MRRVSGKQMNVIRLAALYSHPIQYFAPLFRELAARPEIDLTVYFCSRQGLDVSYDPQFGRAFQWDIPLLEGYKSAFLPNLRRGTDVDGFFRLINPSIITELVRHRYHALLVHGYEHATKWLAVMASKVCGTRLLLRGESHLLDPKPWYIWAAKELMLRRLLRATDKCLYLGQNNKNFYQRYGISENKLVHVPYCVDNAFFRESYRKLVARRKEIRRELMIEDDAPVVLYVGKLIPKKQPLLLFEAFSQVRQHQMCHLLYAGDGELRSQLETTIARSGIAGVHVIGFLNQSEIGKAYIASDILALPSRSEPWGLVVNEAMNFGLPVVVSDRVGCAPDLVHSGKNGYIVPHNSSRALAEALEKLVVDADRRRAFGQRSVEIVQHWDVKRAADGILQALEVSSIGS